MNQLFGGRGVAKMLLIATLSSPATGAGPDLGGTDSAPSKTALAKPNADEFQPTPALKDFSRPASSSEFGHLGFRWRPSDPNFQDTGNTLHQGLAPLTEPWGRNRNQTTPELKNRSLRPPSPKTSAPRSKALGSSPHESWRDRPDAERPTLHPLRVDSYDAIYKNPSENEGPDKKEPQNIRAIPDGRRPTRDPNNLPIASDFGLHEPDPTQLSNTLRRKN
jgi:hypothetical protein